jgi:glutaredoxin
MRLLVYSKNGCPFCSLLKAELATRRISYETFDLSDDVVRASFYANSSKKSVPQVYLTEGEATLTNPSGESLGGWSEVSKLLDSLANRLAGATAA